MWRAQANLPPNFTFSATPLTETVFRIFICVVLGIGVVYGALIINTFRRYGTQMDEAWQRRVQDFIDSSGSQTMPPPPSHHFPYSTAPVPIVVPKSPSRSSESDSSQISYTAAAALGSRTVAEDYETSHPAELTDISMVLPPTRLESPTSNRQQSPASHLLSPSPIPPAPLNKRRDLEPQTTSRSKSQTPSRTPIVSQTSDSDRNFSSTDGPPLHVRDEKKEEERRSCDSVRRHTGRTPSLDGGGHLPKLNIPGEPLPGPPFSSDEPE
jgi:hypothetical protein